MGSHMTSHMSSLAHTHAPTHTHTLIDDNRVVERRRFRGKGPKNSKGRDLKQTEKVKMNIK